MRLKNRVLYGHVFRNAMLLIVAGFPAAFIGILFQLGAAGGDRVLVGWIGRLLGFDSAIRRDYPVMFGTLYMFTLVGLLLQISSGISCTQWWIRGLISRGGDDGDA